jgi:flagellar biosynthesis protein FlhG
MRDDGCDQALGLRRLFERRGLAQLSIAGTAGTTAVTLDLAFALADLGRRVLILDRTHGEAAEGLGLKARYELAHAMRGEKCLADVILQGPNGIHVLPAARSLVAIDAGDRDAYRALSELLDASRDRFDICLVNGLPPASDGTGSAPREVLLVACPTGASVTEAYAQIKTLARERTPCRFRVVVNRAASEGAALSLYSSLAETARRFLSARLDYCGYLPGDAMPSVRGRRNGRGGSAGTNSPRAHAFTRLAEVLASETSIHHAAV